MRSPEERITELEQRVTDLERMIKSPEGKSIQEPTSQGIQLGMPMQQGFHPGVQVPTGYNQQKLKPRDMRYGNSGGYPNIPPQGYYNQRNEGINRGKDKEALVGKYIIGALASVLIFIAAISFTSLMWNKITPEIKLIILSCCSLGITGLGFWLTWRKKSVITSIILGTGAGLTFISIISANLVFHLIGNNISILLAAIWAISFTISSKYTKVFFTTIIAYIGSYFTLVLGLVNMNSHGEMIVLTLFVTVVTGVLLATTVRSKKVELITSILLSYTSYSTLLFGFSLDGIYNNSYFVKGYLIHIIVLLIIYLLMNYLYVIVQHENKNVGYMAVNVSTTLSTMIFLAYIDNNYLVMDFLASCIIFFVIHLIQMIVNLLIHRQVEEWLTRYYGIVLVLVTIFINNDLFQEPTGIVIIGLLLIILERVFKGKEQSVLIGSIVVLDAIFLLENRSNYFMGSIYGIIHLLVIGYLIWKVTDLKQFGQMKIIKILGLIILIINCFGIPANIMNFINETHINQETAAAIGYLLIVLVVISLYKIGYFKDWRNDKFILFANHDEVPYDRFMSIFMYVISIGLYFYGIVNLQLSEYWPLQLVIVIGTIAITVLQSVALLEEQQKNPWIGIWIMLKYFILAWAILHAFTELRTTSVLYSIAGMIIAIGGIITGFKLTYRSIRVFGLVLAIIMVAKFIFVDLNGENSMMRVVSLIIGGGLCFMISWTYNKLSEKKDDEVA